MGDYQEFLLDGAAVPEWPYPVTYGKEQEITCDVLVLGGGVAGIHAALTLARKGMKTVMVEKGGKKSNTPFRMRWTSTAGRSGLRQC